ncbi:hypothetical protein HNR23_003098 [Nocardiopsis mwathae]|uniref:DNA-binding protein n=1 Tax=Nocardiopsis mwathae TaxID=1472723 RepID=A0A7W9YJ13_9ACTN|nr:hypothetical protein [Nocardiopsis mwathae]MBB6173038.1 hypothetical protein [Nocardiopsis mwathae]
MPTHDFTLLLDRLPSDEDYDRLFEAGCDDAQPETSGDACLLHFMREAPTLAMAVVTALRDAETAGFTVTGLRAEDLVTLEGIAARVGRSEEDVRRLSAGEDGPGDFPAPVTDAPWALYRWDQVAPWFEQHPEEGEGAATFERWIAAADHVIQARVLLVGDPSQDTLAEILHAA